MIYVLAILALFLNLKLGYDKDLSTTVYHSYEFLDSSSAVVGAIIATSSFGIYKGIISMSLVFAAGSFIIAIGVIDLFYLPMQ